MIANTLFGALRPAELRGRTFALLILVLLSGLLPAAAARADSATDMQRRVLDVRRRQVELRAERAELDRKQQLFKEGLVSSVEIDRARTSVEKAQLGYQEAILSLLSLQPRIAVKEALKYQDEAGRKFVRLTVTNLTPTFDDEQFSLLNNFEGAEPIPEELKTRDIRDIFISLQDTGGGGGGRGTTIALPYELHIPQLRYGESKTITFQFLRDVQQLVVAANYMGQLREIDIQLQQAESGSAVEISSTQISQEGDLGTQVGYALRLERSSVDVRGFQLRVLNLPRQITWSFVDPASGARLSQLNFPAGVTRQDLELRLFLPEQADAEVNLDAPRQFWAIASPIGDNTTLTESRQWSLEEIKKSGAGALSLEVVPRGIGKIEVAAATLFSEIKAGEQVKAKLTLRNRGTRQLDTVRILAEGPLGWKTEVVPDRVPSIELGKEADVELRVTPPDDVSVGDYEVRIRTESYAYNRRVPSEDKNYRINVKPGSNLVGTLALILALCALVAGAVFFTIRLTRR